MDKKDKDVVGGRKVDDIKKYISRLNVAKRRSEKRILQLGGTLYNQRLTTERLFADGAAGDNGGMGGMGAGGTMGGAGGGVGGADSMHLDRREDDYSAATAVVGLQELLCEPALTYFREFMDNQRQSHLLQYWLTVEAIKGHYLDPLTLESLGGDVPAAVATLFADCSRDDKARALEQTLHSDIRMLHDTYFLDSPPWADAILEETMDNVRYHYAELSSLSPTSDGGGDVDGHGGRSATMPAPTMLQQDPVAYRTLLSTLFGLLLRAQYKVFQFVESQLLPLFLQSDVYIRLLTDPSFMMDVSSHRGGGMGGGGGNGNGNGGNGGRADATRDSSLGITVTAPTPPLSEKPIMRSFGRTISYLDNVFKKRFSSQSVDSGGEEFTSTPNLASTSSSFSPSIVAPKSGNGGNGLAPSAAAAGSTATGATTTTTKKPPPFLRSLSPAKLASFQSLFQRDQGSSSSSVDTTPAASADTSPTKLLHLLGNDHRSSKGDRPSKPSSSTSTLNLSSTGSSPGSSTSNLVPPPPPSSQHQQNQVPIAEGDMSPSPTADLDATSMTDATTVDVTTPMDPELLRADIAASIDKDNKILCESVEDKEVQEIDLLTSDAVEAFEQEFQAIMKNKEEGKGVVGDDDDDDDDEMILAGESESEDDDDDREGEEDELLEEGPLGREGDDGVEPDGPSMDSDQQQQQLPQREGALSRASEHSFDAEKAAMEKQIQSLREQMDIIRQQEALLDLMIQKAALDPTKDRNGHQLKVLQKTKWQSQQDMQSLDFRKTQLELQMNDSVILPGQMIVNITSWSTGDAKPSKLGMKPFVVYIIEISHKMKAGGGWMIARRYSEFDSLNKRLKAAFPSIMTRPGYELPSKRYLPNLPSAKAIKSTLTATLSSSSLLSLQGSPSPPPPQLQQQFGAPQGDKLFDKRDREFLEQRRKALERYLRVLCMDEVVASSWDFRQFLCLSDFSKATTQSFSASGEDSRKSSFAGFSVNGLLNRRVSLRSKLSSSSQPSTKSHRRQHSLPAISVVDMITQKLSATLRRYEGETEESLDSDEETQRSLPASADRSLSASVEPSGSSSRLTIDQPRLTVDGDNMEVSGMGIHDHIREQIEESLGSSITVENARASPTRRYHRSQSPLKGTGGGGSGTGSMSGGGQANPNEDLEKLPIAESLCDLFLELFELKEKNNWLRRQAVMIILQQVLGGAIERRVIENIRYLFIEDMWIWYVERIEGVLAFYSNEEAKKAYTPRTQEERQQTKLATFKKLQFLIPDTLGPMVGRANAKRGTTRIFEVLQNERLNQELLYQIFDAMVGTLVEGSGK